MMSMLERPVEIAVAGSCEPPFAMVLNDSKVLALRAITPTHLRAYGRSRGNGGGVGKNGIF